MVALGKNKPVFMNEDYTFEKDDPNAAQDTPRVIDAVRMKKWLAFMAGAHHNYYTFSQNWNNENRPDEMLDILKKLKNLLTKPKSVAEIKTQWNG